MTTRKQVKVECKAHRALGYLCKATIIVDYSTYPVTIHIDMRQRDVVAAINNHRRAWSCGASLDYIDC